MLKVEKPESETKRTMWPDVVNLQFNLLRSHVDAARKYDSKMYHQEKWLIFSYLVAKDFITLSK